MEIVSKSDVYFYLQGFVPLGVCFVPVFIFSFAFGPEACVPLRPSGPVELMFVDQISRALRGSAFPSLETHATTANTRGLNFGILCDVEEIGIIEQAKMASEVS